MLSPSKSCSVTSSEDVFSTTTLTLSWASSSSFWSIDFLLLFKVGAVKGSYSLGEIERLEFKLI